MNDHNVGRYRQMLLLQHQDNVLAPYLSALNFRSRRLDSRSRCHGLHVDTGQFKPVDQRVDRKQRFCPVCASDTAEDEHQLCLTALHMAQSGTLPFSGDQPLPLSSFFTLHDHRVIAKFLHECFAHRSMLLQGVLGVSQH